ncbi:SDR family NAD(P)-dependent oxidoreductase [Desulforhopalus vacuolatus]|uniref:SDR family NAD(P)-dependent oxidoreductase n=1 Tax=Desulforhopalus vacuolatus TaxID=40414 RepID=UPI0019645FA4|nr:SDR family NAD(P)-dependent oxidoreductase [Desulforhopalus vacuolatus]MBM9521016.1 SDR family NAD(P)-dependent oxidoreductase [Desulforhopalus vacuolatus]
MQKIILVTGSTNGIGRETAKMLFSTGHHVLIHGRNPKKLAATEQMLADMGGEGRVESYLADLSRLADVKTFAKAVIAKHDKLDALLNNAGVYCVPKRTSVDGLDTRFAVNVYAPYLLTRRLLPLLGTTGRVVNSSSAAQSSVDFEALVSTESSLSDGRIYAQSKLALTMWSREMALELKGRGTAVITVNPASMLRRKLIKSAYGVDSDLEIGADILCRAALSDEFSDASGKYYDNDSQQFTPPHPDALDPVKIRKLVALLDAVLAEKL